jgi:hypothetical protein
LLNRDFQNRLSILILSGIFFVPFLGGVHLFDWDEINFAEIAREMMLTGDYLRPQINFEPFWEKPPLFIWMQVLSMHIFGINEFAARFPNAVCGMVSLLVIYATGKRYRDEETGLWWVWCYVGSILPHLYFRSGIIDPWFNLFIFLGITQYLRFRENAPSGKPTHLLLSGLFIGVAVLTKGPVAILIFGLCGLIFGIFSRFRLWLNWKGVAFFVLAFLATTGIWYGMEIAVNGPWFMQEFITYQIRLFQTKDAGHGGFPGYHAVVLLLGCFPASAFALRALFTNQQTHLVSVQQDFRLMMKILFWAVLILFSLVSTKIVHYSSLCYFPLTFLAAEELRRLSEEKRKTDTLTGIVLGISGMLFLIGATMFPLLLLNRGTLIPLMKDPFALETLRAEVSFSPLLFLPPLLIFMGMSAAHFLVRQSSARRGYRFFFGINAIAIASVIYLFIGRAEMFSQQAHIEFAKESARLGIPVQVMGFKSYVPYFYGKSQKRIPGWQQILDEGYPEDIRLVAKINREAEFDGRTDLEKIGHKNGFVFYLKRAANVGK